MKKLLVLFAVLFVLILACGKDDKNKDLPALTTSAPTNVGSDAAIAGGNITSDGGSEVASRGVCWDTITGPTIASDKTEDGVGVGTFTSNITGLIPGKAYFLRAYATNNSGTAYGNEEIFNTTSANAFTDSRDGNTYKTVTIGSQVWMAENLRYLPEVHNNTEFSQRTSPGYGVYSYNGNVLAEAKEHSNYTAYGVLYNWASAKGASPSGWHLPSDSEWNELVDFIKNDGHSGSEGSALKSSFGWNCGIQGTDDYGFKALPAGLRSYSDGGFFDVGNFSNWWTSTDGYSCCITYRSLVCSYGFLDGSPGGHKSAGYYIRCVKD